MLPENYIFYRFPNESKIYFGEILNSSYQSKQSSGSKILSLQSFDKSISEELPIECHNYTDAEIQKLLSKVKLPTYHSSAPIIEKEDYLNLCSKFIKETKENRLQKVILSRIKKVNSVKDICKYYKFLCSKSESSFTYVLFYNGELWIGSTPETLAIINDLQLETMALAGTLSLNDDRDWSDKELEEHKYVADYIIKVLQKYNPTVAPVNEITVGNIKHLITKINATLLSLNDVNHVLDCLHPTPAVCGLPKQKAFKFILENEPHNRGLYTGYLGIKQRNKQRYFVNLRCGQFYNDRTHLYVGGGLTSDSNTVDEYNETEYKSQALYSREYFNDSSSS